jgi:protein disulfide-isomerase A6
LNRFYAPWCGHCKNLQPAYEKAAKNLQGLAKVAAVDCDEESNKSFCSSMGVPGFPTLKIVRPGKKPGKPIVEDYQGARTAKGIVDAVVEKIPNHVKKLTDKDLESWKTGGAKAVLLTDKGTTSSLLKALSVDFLGGVEVVQVRDKEKKTVEKFGVTKFPLFMVFPAGSEEPLVYGGELKKEAMSKFITESTGVSPNPDPAPDAGKKAKAPKADKKKEKKFEQSSKSHKSADASSEKLKATSVELEDESPTPSPDPKVDTPKPVKIREAVNVLDVLETEDEVHAKCLHPSAKTCILALLPKEDGQQVLKPESAAQAILSLSEIRHKLSSRAIFPFYAISASNPLAETLRKELSLKGSETIEVIGVNAKRNWVRKYTKDTYTVAELGEWVDAIKMNEGAKEKLPEALIKEVKIEEKAEPVVKVEPIVEEIKTKPTEEKEKYTVQDGDVMIEVEEVDDDYEYPAPPPVKDEL